jgi:hypothetical protein
MADVFTPIVPGPKRARFDAPPLAFGNAREVGATNMRAIVAQLLRTVARLDELSGRRADDEVSWTRVRLRVLEKLDGHPEYPFASAIAANMVNPDDPSVLPVLDIQRAKDLFVVMAASHTAAAAVVAGHRAQIAELRLDAQKISENASAVTKTDNIALVAKAAIFKIDGVNVFLVVRVFVRNILAVVNMFMPASVGDFFDKTYAVPEEMDVDIGEFDPEVDAEGDTVMNLLTGGRFSDLAPVETGTSNVDYDVEAAERDIEDMELAATSVLENGMALEVPFPDDDAALSQDVGWSTVATYIFRNPKWPRFSRMLFEWIRVFVPSSRWRYFFPVIGRDGMHKFLYAAYWAVYAGASFVRHQLGLPGAEREIPPAKTIGELTYRDFHTSLKTIGARPRISDPYSGSKRARKDDDKDVDNVRRWIMRLFKLKNMLPPGVGIDGTPIPDAGRDIKATLTEYESQAGGVFPIYTAWATWLTERGVRAVSPILREKRNIDIQIVELDNEINNAVTEMARFKSDLNELIGMFVFAADVHLPFNNKVIEAINSFGREIAIQLYSPSVRDDEIGRLISYMIRKLPSAFGEVVVSRIYSVGKLDPRHAAQVAIHMIPAATYKKMALALERDLRNALQNRLIAREELPDVFPLTNRLVFPSGLLR